MSKLTFLNALKCFQNERLNPPEPLMWMIARYQFVDQVHTYIIALIDIKYASLP